MALVTFGLLTTVAGAAVALMDSPNVRVIWDFDRNGLAHIGHMIWLALLIHGLRSALQPPTAEPRIPADHGRITAAN